MCFLGSVILLFMLGCNKSKKGVQKAWTIEKHYVNNIDYTDSMRGSAFGRPLLLLIGDDKIILPDMNLYNSPIYYSSSVFDKWIFYKKGLVGGYIEIIDSKQNGFFSGIYNIENISTASSTKIRLYSNTIEFILVHEFPLYTPSRINFSK
jgi:hypothetical protein